MTFVARSHTSRATQALSLSSAALVAALVLTSCGSGSGGSGDSGADDALKVVATTTQLADFAGRVGGDDIELTGLLKAGASAHHFDPSPADLLALGEADVLIVNGAGLETFVDSAVEASGFDGAIITAADGIDLAEAEAITAEGAEAQGHGADDHDHDHDHGTESHHHGEDHDHEEAADGHGDEGHDHGGLNPHIWTSPGNAEGMVGEIARGLAAADPEHAADFERRASEYEEQLAALDEWIHEQVDAVPTADRVLVSGHDSLRYYLHDYGIDFAGAILPSFEDNAEPSAAQIDALVDSIRKRGVKAIFVESSMSPKLARTVAEESGARVVDADSLYADSLGAPGSGADTYLSATEHNTRVILEAWGAEAGALPAALAAEAATDSSEAKNVQP